MADKVLMECVGTPAQALLVFPILEALSLQVPRPELIVFTNAVNADLFQNHPHVRTVIQVPLRLVKFSTEWVSVLEEMTSFQASVFISPFRLNREAVWYLKKTGLIEYIRILRVDEMDEDKHLKKHFHL